MYLEKLQCDDSHKMSTKEINHTSAIAIRVVLVSSRQAKLHQKLLLPSAFIPHSYTPTSVVLSQIITICLYVYDNVQRQRETEREKERKKLHELLIGTEIDNFECPLAV